MVMMAYLAGLVTTPAAVLGVLGGMWWWRALRRAQGTSDVPLRLTPLVPPSPSPPPQAVGAVNRISLGSVPGYRRNVRGRRPHTGRQER